MNDASGPSSSKFYKFTKSLAWYKLTSAPRLTPCFSLYLSAEELFPEPGVLLHAQRRHLCPLPVIHHTERAGEGNAEDEPVQD